MRYALAYLRDFAALAIIVGAPFILGGLAR